MEAHPAKTSAPRITALMLIARVPFLSLEPEHREALAMGSQPRGAVHATQQAGDLLVSILVRAVDAPLVVASGGDSASTDKRAQDDAALLPLAPRSSDEKPRAKGGARTRVPPRH